MKSTTITKVRTCRVDDSRTLLRLENVSPDRHPNHWAHGSWAQRDTATVRGLAAEFTVKRSRRCWTPARTHLRVVAIADEHR